MSQLQQQFITTFSKQRTFTTKEVHEWYCTVKRNPTIRPARVQVFELIIWPLLYKHIIERMSRGEYRFTNVQFKEDEFDKYIKSKLKGGDTK